jgi:glucose-1-phosphate thymidylyltransferase
LLEVGGKTILEHILSKIEKVESIDNIYIVTNNKFYDQFQSWIELYKCPKAIKVINDLTDSNNNRLGAVADIRFVLDTEKIHEDILVMAGDNLFEFDLGDFEAFYNQVGHDCITAHVLNDINELKRTGVVELDDMSRVISFEEKPEEPRSHFAVPPFYIYKESTLNLIGQYLNEGNNPDAPGNFIPWLITKEVVYAYRFKGMRYDIGTLKSYIEAQELYK